MNMIDQLYENKTLSKRDMLCLLNNINEERSEYLFEKARDVAKNNFGNKIYIRGLIEFSNYCKNDCYYCGIRRSNSNIQRYRLNKAEILECCREGYELGFRTFVLQGGEDNYYSGNVMVNIVSAIRNTYPDCAITLSMGELDRELYERLFNAGANRYLLRHESATDSHYMKLHPEGMTLENRMKCLNDLKEIGYQVGCGFMVGSPYQTLENIVSDLIFISEFQPHMVGIGPFISHCDTPFKNHRSGSVDLTLFLLGVVRLMCPNVLLPATTALGTLDMGGRERGILSGANVLMPNLSPLSVRKKYMLYDNKIATGQEAAESINKLSKSIAAIGYEIVNDRGDFRKI